ncbi:MAG TPA: hypothetical protein VIH37_05390, partial [Candidatus Limnocylindrales bacterium]
SPDLDNASATFRALVVRLGDQAADGAHDPSEDIRPLVDALLELREQARRSRDFATADVIRGRLAAAGVEVRDEAGGATWVLGER